MDHQPRFRAGPSLGWTNWRALRVRDSRLSGFRGTHPQIDLCLLYVIPIHATILPLNSSFQVAHPSESQLRPPMSYMNANCPYWDAVCSPLNVMIFSPHKVCFVLLISPETSLRVRDAQHANTSHLFDRPTTHIMFSSPVPAILGTILLSNPVFSANATEWSSRSIYQVTRQLICACACSQKDA